MTAYPRYQGVVLLGVILFCLTLCAEEAPSFSGRRAFRYLQEQCALGTREPNSPGHRAFKDYLETFLKKQNGRYRRDDFTVFDERPFVAESLHLTNFHMVFGPEKGPRVLVGAHWDTRPWADEDPDPSLRRLPIPGANDGASGTAVLMVFCEMLSAAPPRVPVEIVFFDGEDGGMRGDDYWCLGSKHMAAAVRKTDYRCMILLDLIGDADLAIRQERLSLRNAPRLVHRIWDTARRLDAHAFIPEPGPEVYDDHVPFIQKGIPSVDIIDFQYPYWHTMADTLEHCSPASLKTVGIVIFSVIRSFQPV